MSSLRGLRRVPVAMVLLACVTWVPGSAIGADPPPFEAGGGAGWIEPGSKRHLDGAGAGLFTLGYRYSNAWGIEAFAMRGNNQPEPGFSANDMVVYGLRGLYHFYNPSIALTPYLSLGGGVTDFKGAGNESSALAGAGFKYALDGNWSLRAEANLHYGFQSKATDLSVFIGAVYQFGARRAPAPAPAPPAVAPTAVAAAAPPPLPDADEDGVPDLIDKCPNTPKGVKVDAIGCPLDSDGDGVPDYLDKCPNTPFGTKVDATGCPMKLTEKVSITLKVNFDTAKADIKPEFAAEIRRVADFMRRYAGTRVVIEGHTDNVGSSTFNQKLAERRAQAVAQSLVRDHGIASDRVRSAGYGESRPIADNRTEEGRAANRRVTAQIEETVTRNP